jgi:signal transduction histidine kinase
MEDRATTCPGCRRKTSSRARFCPACGRRLGAAVASGATVAPPAAGVPAPTLAGIARTAARRLRAGAAQILLVDGARLRVAAHEGPSRPAGAPGARLPLSRGSIAGLAVLQRRSVNVRDLGAAAARRRFPETVASARPPRRGSVLAVPVLLDGEALGAVVVGRRRVEPFGPADGGLLRAFADHAAVAVQSARRGAALAATLDQRVAEAEILGVISRSPGDLQPVFEGIVESARRLLHAHTATVTRVAAGQLELVAYTRTDPAADAMLQSRFPQPVRSNPGIHARAIRERAVLNVEDTETDPRLAEANRAYARARGYRSWVTVPLVHQGQAVGTIAVTRREPGGFSPEEIGLLRTFAGQAVIAIENVRLFGELQARNRDLTEALERQTATADILRVISETRGSAQPVFDAIAASALRLLHGTSVVVTRVFGDRMELAALRPPRSEEVVRRVIQETPRGPGRYVWAAVLDREVKQIADVEAAGVDPDLVVTARVRGWRANISVPMLQDGEPVGVIFVARETPGLFTPQQVELLRTFADQAAIAVKNAALFTDVQARTAELQRSVDQLTALGEVGRAVSSTLDLETVLTTIVSRAVELSGLDGGVVFEYDEAAQEFIHRAQAGTGGPLAPARRITRIRTGEGVVGRTGLTLAPVQLPDITAPGAYVGPNRDNLIQSGIRAVVAVPMVYEGRLVGSLAVTRNRPGAFPPETVELLRTFATQSALAIQNARLFHALEDKSRQLEVASRHKSEFLASMSHELRTPLNAILGFNEMILGGIYGDVPADLREPLAEMQASGRHLLRLINNVLDLSKIEAGRMELALADYSVPDTVEQVRAALHPLAAEKGLDLVTAVPADLPLARGDAGRIGQCLTNLVGNAIKFTRQGRVEVAAGLEGDRLVYRVSDSGIGIAPDRLDTLFTEFRQADATIASEFGGSGLGLSITRKFAELHGGRVWVESEPGKGSTFFLAVPLRVAEGAPA